MKKILFGLLIMFVGVITANAEEIYYSNMYGVKFNKQQYEFFSKMYYEGYQAYMTKEDFNYFSEIEMKGELVESNSLNNFIMPMSELVTGTKKTLKISESNSTSGIIITVVADWFKNPSTKSNDVIGARFVGTNLVETPITKMINSNGFKNYTNIDNFSNGFGQTLVPGMEVYLNLLEKV